MADNPRLSNLGIEQGTSAGSGVDAVFGADKLSQLLEGTAGLEERLNKMRAAPRAGGMEQFANKRNLPMLALAALSAALGGEEGQAAAAGMIAGTAGAAATQASELQARRQQEIDTMQEILDRRRTAITTLLTAQPGMFVDSSGKDTVDPAVLGMAATGVPLPLSPASILAERGRTLQQQQRVDFWSTRLKEAVTPEQAIQAGRQLSNTLGLNLTAEDMQTLATLDETGFWTNLADNSTLDTGSVLSAWVYSLQNGKDRFSSDVIGKLKAKGASGGNISLDDYTVALVAEWNAAIEANPALARLPADQQVDTIFRSKPGDMALLKQKLKTAEGEPAYIGTEVLRDAFLQTQQTINSLFLLAPEAAQKMFGSKEQAIGRIAEITRAQLTELNRELAGQHAQRAAAVYKQLEDAYMIQYPDADPITAMEQALKIFGALVSGVEGDPTAPDFDIQALRDQANAAIKAGLPK